MIEKILKLSKCSLMNHSALFLRRNLTNSSLKGSETSLYDLIVIGGGIVGCATARRIKLSNPQLKIAILEKESVIAAHQSSNNSGVLHAGIYYKPGSLKAKLCVRGIDLAYEYLDKSNVPYKRVGKLIVAVEPEEIKRLENLYERAQENGCKMIEMIPGNQIKEYAPYCRGLKAMWSPYTGIVDWGDVTKSFAEDFKQLNGDIYLNYDVNDIKLLNESSEPGKSNDYPLILKTKSSKTDLKCKYLITCCGLQSDRIAQISGCSATPKILPFRGEYLLLRHDKRHYVPTNIYPVPDPRFPFLGVHFTPRMNGDVWLGPNAVLAYKREGYSYFDVSLADLFDSLSYRGMHKLMFKYLTYGVKEMYRGIFIGAQVKQLQRFMPELSLSDVERGPAGVRAQAVDGDGNLIDEFVFDSGHGNIGQRVLHVRNAPSPAATSSLAIAEMIHDEAKMKFGI